jgi:hypothetical protein
MSEIIETRAAAEAEIIGAFAGQSARAAGTDQA